MIPRNVRLAEAPSFGVPALKFDQHSKGAQAYLTLAGEIVITSTGTSGALTAAVARGSVGGTYGKTEGDWGAGSTRLLATTKHSCAGETLACWRSMCCSRDASSRGCPWIRPPVVADSIKAQGVMQPFSSRRSAAGRYEVIAGERRWRAARLAGLATVPALVRDVADRDALALALIENIQREDLNPLEEAAGLSASSRNSA